MKFFNSKRWTRTTQDARKCAYIMYMRGADSSTVKTHKKPIDFLCNFFPKT